MAPEMHGELRPDLTKFRVPSGFTLAQNLEPNYATIDDYRRNKLTVPEVGTFAQNNGTIAAVDTEGRIHLWIPMSDPKQPRTVSHDEAVQSLLDAGFRDVKSSFYVPQSND